MRKVTLPFISMALACFTTVAAEVPAGGQEAVQQVETPVSPAGLVVEPVAQGPGKILHLGIVIHVVNREQPLWVYKQLCEDEVIPAFLAEMKEQDPELAKTIAERIVVQMHQPTDTIWVYIKDGYPARMDSARRLGEMAARRFNALDQAKRVQLMGQLAKEKNKKMYALRAHCAESPYGQIKHNLKFRIFMRRGREKVRMEMAFFFMLHNILKIGNKLKNAA